MPFSLQRSLRFLHQIIVQVKRFDKMMGTCEKKWCTFSELEAEITPSWCFANISHFSPCFTAKFAIINLALLKKVMQKLDVQKRFKIFKSSQALSKSAQHERPRFSQLTAIPSSTAAWRNPIGVPALPSAHLLLHESCPLANLCLYASRPSGTESLTVKNSEGSIGITTVTMGTSHRRSVNDCRYDFQSIRSLIDVITSVEKYVGMKNNKFHLPSISGTCVVSQVPQLPAEGTVL